MYSLTQEWILKTLIDFGFKREEAEIYLLLYRNGPKTANDISVELKIYRRKVYRILKQLQETKIINGKTNRPTKFEVIPFDKFLDLLMKNYLNEANLLEESKPKLFANWKSITRKTEFDERK